MTYTEHQQAVQNTSSQQSATKQNDSVHLIVAEPEPEPISYEPISQGKHRRSKKVLIYIAIAIASFLLLFACYRAWRRGHSPLQLIKRMLWS